MKNSKKATSIAEAIIVLLIVVSGVTGMYKIYDESINLSDGTTNKIHAIQIAKQGIEAFTNIRDTNWLMFSSDYENCWNTLNYESDCIGISAATDKIKHGGKYKIYKDSTNKWLLATGATAPTAYEYTDADYLSYYRVWLEDNGVYTQTGIVKELKPAFTREIEINYSAGNETDQELTVKSLVQWTNKSSDHINKVEIEQVLTNWKK